MDGWQTSEGVNVPCTRSRAKLPSFAHRVLRLLTALNLVTGALILALLLASLFAESLVMQGLGLVLRSGTNDHKLFTAARLIMILGLCAIPVLHFVFTQLRAILGTIQAGNPFRPANAARLQAIAWALVALECLHIAVCTVAVFITSAGIPLDIKPSLSPTRWLAILLLFVLARVFEQGAHMREELEGMV